jgi:hypothetical protein
LKKVFASNSKPDGSIIDRGLTGTIDYLDSFCIDMQDADGNSIDYLTAILFTSFPDWAWGLMKLRDALVRPFGLMTGLIPSQESISRSVFYDSGDRAIFFTVIDRTESEIVMSEDDKHLNFRTSVLINRAKNGRRATLHLTTLVQFHNFWGSFYFFPVKPFHEAIMKALLRRLAKTIDRDSFHQEKLCKPT